MRNKKVLLITETAITIALCVVLNFVAIRLPFSTAGGSISLTMLPIAILALRRGPIWGCLAGLVFGLIDFMIDPYIVHWVQVILDYPAPYALFGLFCGFFRKPFLASVEKQKAKAAAISVAAVIVGCIVRFASHCASGAIFFAEYVPEGQSILAYNLAYNISYLGPSLIAVAILATIIAIPLCRVLPVED